MPTESDPVISQEGEEEFAELIASLDPLKLQELALSARRGLSPDLSSSIYCTVTLPPSAGSFNLVYKASFSDGLTWAIRIPAYTDDFSPSNLRSMHLDIVAQRFISSHTSIPLPRIHHYCLNGNNGIERPYYIMDFLPGTILCKLWNDKVWISPSKRQYIFNQIAVWMTELSALEFDQIGRLDVDENGKHIIVPFPDIEHLLSRSDESVRDPQPTGPFDSASVYLGTLLQSMIETDRSPALYLLRLFAGALSDPSLDGPPFTLCPPNFDSQNVLVESDGTITGLIDWDGVGTEPRQGGAAAYPAWITVDWDPSFYGWSKNLDDPSRFDSPDELNEYRKMYLDAIDRASAGRLTSITRNSHLWTTLIIGATSFMAVWGVMNHLYKFIFGSSSLGYKVEKGIQSSPWYWLGQEHEEEIARVPDNSDDSDDGNSSHDE